MQKYFGRMRRLAARTAAKLRNAHAECSPAGGRNRGAFKFLTVRDLVSRTTRRGCRNEGRRQKAEPFKCGMRNAEWGKTSTEANEGTEWDSVGETPTGATGTVALPDWGDGPRNGRNRAVFKFLTVRDLISRTARRGCRNEGRRQKVCWPAV
jgi:hypothetical protein